MILSLPNFMSLLERFFILNCTQPHQYFFVFTCDQEKTCPDWAIQHETLIEQDNRDHLLGDKDLEGETDPAEEGYDIADKDDLEGENDPGEQ